MTWLHALRAWHIHSQLMFSADPVRNFADYISQQYANVATPAKMQRILHEVPEGEQLQEEVPLVQVDDNLSSTRFASPGDDTYQAITGKQTQAAQELSRMLYAS